MCSILCIDPHNKGRDAYDLVGVYSAQHFSLGFNACGFGSYAIAYLNVLRQLDERVRAYGRRRKHYGYDDEVLFLH